MKYFVLLLVLSLFACGHNRLQFASKHHPIKKEAHHEQSKRSIEENPLLLTQNIDSSNSTLFEPNSTPEITVRTTIQRSNETTTFHSTKELIQNYNLSELNHLRKVYKASSKSVSGDEAKRHGAITMIILGLLLAVGMIIFVINVPIMTSVDTTSVGGCSGSIAIINFLFLVGILLGLGGLALLIIGLVTIKRIDARKKERLNIQEDNQE